MSSRAKRTFAAVSAAALLLLLACSTLATTAAGTTAASATLLPREEEAASSSAPTLQLSRRPEKPDEPPSPPSPSPPPPSPPSPPSPPKKESGASAFAALAAAYALLGAVAAAQLYRIHARVPEFGWTTQKVFHALNAAVCALRALGFAFHPWLEARAPPPLAELLFDAPGLLFFTTYTLLVLFWAEIYHQARALPTRALRPAFLAANGVVYGVQAALWGWGAVLYEKGKGGGKGGGGGSSGSGSNAPRVASLAFLAAASAAAAAGFVVYGGRLFLMLRRFPIESRGRQKKLREVGAVAATCAACFGARAAAAAWLAAASAEEGSGSGGASLDVAGHGALNLFYYGVSELLPSALVLYILRRLPPKRAGDGYQQIPAAG